MEQNQRPICAECESKGCEYCLPLDIVFVVSCNPTDIATAHMPEPGWWEIQLPNGELVEWRKTRVEAEAFVAKIKGKVLSSEGMP